MVLWSTLSYTMPINPIHCGVTHTGKVLVVAGSENEPDEEEYRAAVWDPGTGTIIVQDLAWDVFCNGMACLPDGRWVIVGGTSSTTHFKVSLGRPCLIRRQRNSMRSRAWLMGDGMRQ